MLTPEINERLTRVGPGGAHRRRAASLLEGGEPVGVAPSYYNLRAMDKIVPDNADWHAQMMDIMYPTTPAATAS